jgi:hypothetical protein
MTEEAEPPVLTARRAAQHIRLFEAYDACKRLCILTNATKPSPVSALCWQMHRFLAVAMPLFASVGTLSEGFERSVASPLLPHRLHPMGRMV